MCRHPLVHWHADYVNVSIDTASAAAIICGAVAAGFTGFPLLLQGRAKQAFDDYSHAVDLAPVCAGQRVCLGFIRSCDRQ